MQDLVGLSRSRKLCCECGEWSADAVLVQVIESGSGPGGLLYACRAPCAVICAGRHCAPDWLRAQYLDDSGGQAGEATP
ncbi:hypothetical protein [Streptomyces daliensis]|uniref:Uncharacterized protein n=1 Tax=Streptomyces daliensis TaxID=299421 RepID=A0A8T4IPT3_9ACTN|nr:hypothetical protein [Streptomyces daliensis]